MSAQRSKTPLALMEQVIMVLVFALAAAVCLWAFVWADQSSKAVVARDQAALAAQNAAEAIKHEGRGGKDADAVLAAVAQRLGGTYDADAHTLLLTFSGDWEPTAATDAAPAAATGAGSDAAADSAGEKPAEPAPSSDPDAAPAGTAGPDATYLLLATADPTGVEGLAEAVVTVSETNATEAIFELPVAWQTGVG